MLPPRVWLPLVTQTGAECQCCLLLAVSLSISGSLVGARPPASLLLAWLSGDLLIWGLVVFWAFEGPQPCPALTSWCGQVGIRGKCGGIHLTLQSLGQAAQGSAPPSSPAPLSQAGSLSTYSPDANGQMALVPAGPGSIVASGWQMPQPGTDRPAQSQWSTGGGAATSPYAWGLSECYWPQELSGHRQCAAGHALRPLGVHECVHRCLRQASQVLA